MRILFTWMLLVVVQSVMATDIHTVPADIRAYFKQNSCSEVLDYYLQSRVIEKPYLYGVRSAVNGTKTKNDFSFLAWCKSTTRNADRPYVLVGRLDGATWPGGCKFPIQGFDFPGGLSVSKKKINLSMFTNFEYQSAGSHVVLGPVIRSEMDGLVYEVLCHDGAWVKRNID